MTVLARKACILCDQRKRRSREDAVPLWVQKLLAEGTEGPYETVVDGVRTRTPSARVPRSVTRRPCIDCNGWMNRTFEQPAQPFVSRLILGETIDLDAADQRTVGTWCAKTLLMMRLTRSPPKAPPHSAPQFPEQEYRYLREAGEPSERVRVWIGAYAPKETDVLVPHLLTPSPHRNHLFNGAVQPSTVQLKHLVVQLVFGEADAVRGFQSQPETLGLLLPVWPAGSATITWPPRFVMDDVIFKAVSDQLALG